MSTTTTTTTTTATQRRKARTPARKHGTPPVPIPPAAPRYLLVSNGDDWEGFYVDGELMRQDHSLKPQDILSAMGIEIEKRWVSYDYTAERGDLPERLRDIPADAFQD